MKLFRSLALYLVALSSWAGEASAESAPSTVLVTLTQSDHGGGRVYLPVRIGNVMGTMRLDTGASTTRVALAPWNKDLPIVAKSASIVASGKATGCEDVEARSVELKAAQGNNIGRAKYEITRCAAGGRDDLLGLDFFKGARFALDFQRREMTFFKDAPAAGRPKPFRLLGPDRGLVGVELRTGGVSAVGLFDTGAELSAVDRRFVDKHKKLFAPVKAQGKAGEAGGKTFSHKIYMVKELDLGNGRILRGVPALVYDFGELRNALGPETPFILGYNVLSKFKWRLDFKAPDAPMWDAEPN